MKIYVVRHGQTDYNVMGIFQGHIDVELNNIGIEQAKETSKKLKDKNIDLILSSPLIRAKQTAEYIKNNRNIPIIIDERLIERSFGDMEGHKNREDCNIEMLTDYEANYNICNVESIQDMFKRVYEGLEEIIKEYKGKNILLVTHGAVSQAIECFFNQMPDDKDIEKLTLKNCEYREYKI